MRAETVGKCIYIFKGDLVLSGKSHNSIPDESRLVSEDNLQAKSIIIRRC